MRTIRFAYVAVPVALLALFGGAACTRHAILEEVRVAPAVVCPCEPVRAEVIRKWTRRVEVVLEPPGTTRPVETEPSDALAVTTVIFPEVCESAVVTATGLLADPETEPAVAATHVTVVDVEQAIEARSDPRCGPSCSIAGWTPIEFDILRFSESIAVDEVCNRSDRRVTLTSPGGVSATLAETACTPAFAGVPLRGTWGVSASPRIFAARREVCPDPSCTLGSVGPLPAVVGAPPLRLDFAVGCPPG